jgi:hypothetical protein
LKVKDSRPSLLASTDHGSLVMCLGYREPGEEAWTIWLAVPCQKIEALAHNVSWAGYQRYLRRVGPPTDEIVSACRSALGSAGLLVDEELPPAGEEPLHGLPGAFTEFVRAVAVTMRT